MVSLSSAEEIHGVYLLPQECYGDWGTRVVCTDGVETGLRRLNEEAKEWSFLIQKTEQLH